MLRLVMLIGLLGSAHVAMAEQVRMTGDDIKRAMPGALLEIDTPLRIVIPVKVGTDGLVSAEAGALGLTLGATKDRGRWWTDGDKLCMKWFRWFDAKVRCMVLHREGNRVHWAEGSGESGTATITEAAPVVAAAAPKPKKEKKVVTAALSESVATSVESDASAPAAEPAATPPAEAQTAPDATAANAPSATPDTSPAPEAPAAPNAAAVPETPATSDRTPALQFAAAALMEALPKPAPITPSKLGMTDAAPADSPPPAVAAEPSAESGTAEPTAEAPVPPPVVESQPKQKPKVKVAVAAPPVHTAAPPTRRPGAVAKPVQVSFRVSGVVEGDTLNVRSGPSEYHPAVGRIPASGRGVHIVGACRELWCPIKQGKLKGWVNRYYLAEDVTLRR